MMIAAGARDQAGRGRDSTARQRRSWAGEWVGTSPRITDPSNLSGRQLIEPCSPSEAVRTPARTPATQPAATRGYADPPCRSIPSSPATVRPPARPPASQSQPEPARASRAQGCQLRYLRDACPAARLLRVWIAGLSWAGMQTCCHDDGSGPFEHRKARSVGGLSSLRRHPGPGPPCPPGQIDRGRGGWDAGDGAIAREALRYAGGGPGARSFTVIGSLSLSQVRSDLKRRCVRVQGSARVVDPVSGHCFRPQPQWHRGRAVTESHASPRTRRNSTRQRLRWPPTRPSSPAPPGRQPGCHRFSDVRFFYRHPVPTVHL